MLRLLSILAASVLATLVSSAAVDSKQSRTLRLRAIGSDSAVPRRTIAPLSQCSTIHISWPTGTAPYNVTVYTFDTASEQKTSDSSLPYLVSASPGEQLSFFVVDAHGKASRDGPFDVVTGSNTCLSDLSRSANRDSRKPLRRNEWSSRSGETKRVIARQFEREAEVEAEFERLAREESFSGRQTRRHLSSVEAPSKTSPSKARYSRSVEEMDSMKKRAATNVRTAHEAKKSYYARTEQEQQLKKRASTNVQSARKAQRSYGVRDYYRRRQAQAA